MHDERWRQIATFRGDDDDPKERFVYHAAGLDGMGDPVTLTPWSLRTRTTATGGGMSPTACSSSVATSATWRNDTALIATDVGALVEATKFAGYGESFNVPAGDVNSDGDWDAGDSAAITGGYDVNKDIDMDGAVSAADITAADAVTGGYHVEGRGVVSADEVAIRKGYAGYEVDPILLGSDLIAAIHHVRHRVFSSYTGRWSRRDPLGYVDGMGVYVYVASHPLSSRDYSGLARLPCGSACGGSDPTGQWWPEYTPSQPVPTLPSRYKCQYESDRRRMCEICADQAIHDPAATELIQHMRAKCGWSPRNLSGEQICSGGTDCESSPSGWGGMARCNSRNMRVCFNNIRCDTPSNFCYAIRQGTMHELWHMYDCCIRYSFPGEACYSSLCKEVRAMRFAGQCRPGSGAWNQAPESEAQCLRRILRDAYCQSGWWMRNCPQCDQDAERAVEYCYPFYADP